MTQLGMFTEAEEHDAGGKVKTKLAPGIQGDAVFTSIGNKHRPQLRRWIGESFPELFMMIIGMNPSTAGPTVNDPTITREWGFAQREGYYGFVKFNVSDYRATFPKDLLKDGVELSSAMNEPLMLTTAYRADIIVLAHGKLLKPLRPIAARIIAQLKSNQQGHKLKCFGKNADGSPKHPLYLASSTPLIDF